MLSHWPIRTKLKLGLGLLLVSVLALFGSAHYGLYAYRSLVRTLSPRSTELLLADKISANVSNLRVALSQAVERQAANRDAADNIAAVNAADYDADWLRDQCRFHVEQINESLTRYRNQLDLNRTDAGGDLGDYTRERETLARIDASLAVLGGGDLGANLKTDWMLGRVQLGRLTDEVDKLRLLVDELPTHLLHQLQIVGVDVRSKYRTAITAAWVNAVLAVMLLIAARRVFYNWFATPVETLVEGSRTVAAGNFEHRIRLETRDELGELADAMNAMTDRFRVIRDDLDRQVRERTTQVVRSEQLASVGFLAAGVSHEINNPLASIALCSESLEGRLEDLLQCASVDRPEDVQVARNYLQMIQREAFRCKQITEKLLDFARRGDSQRHAADLRELAAGVIEMVQHLGQFHDKHLELVPGLPVIASVNAQELKQVVLNLITNALESVDSRGRVRIAVDRDAAGAARIVIEDNGCGMSDEVRKHLFEPFFTRRRSGQGTGLGLSITHRIIEEHHGHIEAHSDGPGQGSRFVVTLPAASASKETHHRYQAA